MSILRPLLPTEHWYTDISFFQEEEPAVLYLDYQDSIPFTEESGTSV